ncbi:hypothetical protein WJX81_003979 [Elliptochloris bilobata]|uniref:CAP-Gly domain-containing protein n=1 Tax=Elliptochloris bilobata TaxID=381761 RepID=A0AAW1QYL0_9CHLO
MALPTLGARVLIGNKAATVRYVGPVDGQTGAWVGLEWDNAAHGKHSGCTGGRQYFTCASGAFAGTFVRAEKFLCAADFGVTFLEALRRRYQAGIGEQPRSGPSRVEATPAAQPHARRRDVGVEVVGAHAVCQRQGRLEALTSAGLQNARVAFVGPRGELAAAAPAIEELDLAGVPDGQLFGALRLLVLNRTGATWAQVLRLGPWLPALVELHACGNAIRSLAVDGLEEGSTGMLARLQALDLEDNALAEWAEVARLAPLTALTRLQLSGNRLAGVACSAQQPGSPAAFERLQVLLLGDNALSGWADVEAMAAFPALAEARLSGNPVLRSAPGGGRYEVIARLPMLRALNGAAVPPSERRDAELRYLRRVEGELAAAQGNLAASSAAAAAHPRLQALQARYGAMDGVAPPPSGRLPGSTLAAGLLELHLTCTAPGHGPRSVVKRVPSTLTLGRLKLLCERLFRLPAARQALWARGGGGGERALAGAPDRDLSFLGLQAGAEVVVSESDADAARSTEAAKWSAAPAAHEQRLLRQLQEAEQLQALQQPLARQQAAS